MGNGRISAFADAFAKEPPLRLISRALIKRFSRSVRTQELWDTASRPHYLTGLLAASEQAIRERIHGISAFEFGVGEGSGLLALAHSASEVEKETGVKIKVYGFDTGNGLPEFCGDHRDLPDQWQIGDYPMNQTELRASLPSNTQLIIGNIKETLPNEIKHIGEPIGFVSIDIDIYSSARAALRIFTLANSKMLMHVPMYFDDLDLFAMHRFAGELLAIEEFNGEQQKIKIDRWRGIEVHRPFFEARWLKKMYVAHDLEAISNYRSVRAART